MSLNNEKQSYAELVEKLNFREKVDRSLALLEESCSRFKGYVVVANSLGKDSGVVWHLAKKVDPNIKGFIVTTRYKPRQTKAFMAETVSRYPELKVYDNDVEVPEDLYKKNPSRCCYLLKVEPARRAIKESGAKCWITGLRCTEGDTRKDVEELEKKDNGLFKLNPILLWKEREIWQYIAVNGIKVNPLYAEGYRSLGCAPCTRITTGECERSGRWSDSGNKGGECGLHLHAFGKRRGGQGSL